MATAVIMPKQGQSVETCIITKWFKNKGEIVSVGDILLSYETDKAAFDLESPADGILLDRYFEEGNEVPVLVNVAVIGREGEATGSFDPQKTDNSDTSTSKASTASKAFKAVEAVKAINAVEAAEARNSGLSGSPLMEKIRISPRARRLAIDNNVDYNKLQGSGPNGRIIASDIERVLAGSVTAKKVIRITDNEFTEGPISNVRRLIAKAMQSSLQNSAQVTHHMSADVRQLLEARQKIKSQIAGNEKQQDITINDMVCWCVVKALEKFPEANSHFLDDRIKTFHKVHLGVAVDTSRGLMVPVVRNADDMNLVELSKELKSVAEACRKGSINPELIRSDAASFTVSNLGSYGVEMFTPVINLPQVGILGVCSIVKRPADMGNNIFGFVPYIGLSLTYDHRAIDGGPATLFLREIKGQIEKFRY
jgi:pyruvate dehydrogenase E2 component (dihydrolipoamide acetyltransferase)